MTLIEKFDELMKSTVEYIDLSANHGQAYYLPPEEVAEFRRILLGEEEGEATEE